MSVSKEACMYVLPLDKASRAIEWFDRAAKLAERSLCLRARCAAIIVKGHGIVGSGFNGPPRNNPAFRTCLDEYAIPAGFRHDRTCCIHAEQRAITSALRNGANTDGARIYFVNINERSEKIFATDVKCTICSRAVLEAGIAEFALYTERGVAIYDAAEFNELSYAFHTPRRAAS